MTNAELIQAIRSEIERRIEELNKDKYISIDAQVCRTSELNYLLRFLSTLEKSEKPIPKDLEEAAEHHTCKAVDAVKRRGWELETQDITDAFIAGAKWDRQQMLKEAVEGEFENEFIGIVNFNTDFTKYGYSEHDKVRVIVLPKED